MQMDRDISARPITRRHFLTGAAAGAALMLTSRPVVARSKPVPGSEIFAKPTLLNFRLTFPADAIALLREKPRTWVPARVRVDDREYEEVAVHVKGSQGSVRPFDDKPALTLSFNKFASEQRLFGLRKIHLNNSVQDPTYLCEYLTGELFRRAGVPATRVAWATVEVNGRKLGLFVLKEGFAKEFLGLHFADTHGNLYDGGLHREVDEPLDLESGDGVKDHSDLRGLAAAAHVADPAERWQRLGRVLDVDRFVPFMAMEILTDHIDGYCLMQNNYRVYFDGPSKPGAFLPHGTDRMFGRQDASLEPPMRALVAKAVLGTREGQERYRRCLTELTERVFMPAWMLPSMDEVVRLLDAADPLVTRESRPLRDRITARAAFARSNAPAVLRNRS